MTDTESREAALREHDRMRVLASEMRQLGFKECARFLNENAAKALKYAARPLEVMEP